MTGNAHVTQDAVFVGANKQGLVADYVPNLVAFGAGTTVALWNPLAADKKGVYLTLNKHTKEVTCVKFLDPETLISCAEDGLVCVWQKTAAGFSLYQTIEQDSSIVALDVSEDIFVTGNTSGQICIWEKDGEEFKNTHSFSVKSGFYPAVIALQKVLHHHIMVIGGTSCDLYVYSFGDGTEVTQCAVLSGHEDWVKCLAFVTEVPGSNYILASGSQDRYIRLWRLRLNEAIDDSDEDDTKLILLSNKQYKFNMGTDRAAFSFEALIMGHDDWVTGLQWHPSNSGSTKKLQLLSLSADTALMIWEMDQDSGIWVTVSRLGELSIKGASTATGASGGFWSCLWFEDLATHDLYILTNGKTGAIRAYKSAGDELRWDSVLGVTGSTREITDLAWSKDGTYFTTTSLDQTTRLIAPWIHHRAVEDGSYTWHEFARPQIHGYDMMCLDNLSSSRFVSGGDEKILRVFEMTQSIGNLLKRFCDVDIEAESLPDAASLPVLGLSNKAANEQLEAGEAQQREEDDDSNTPTPTENVDPLSFLETPPLEDHLQRLLLYPEVEKLYGHGYEITCCTTSPKTLLIASACRSNSARHAVIRIFNTANDFQLVDEVLKGHNLTITSMEFSPDGQYLLAVSRDRQLSLWKVKDEQAGTFDLVELNTKAHSRIIWDCSWAPDGSPYFVTGSRDKSIKLWAVTDKVTVVSVLKTNDAVTSVACCQALFNGNLLIAVGHESGEIALYAADLTAATITLQKILGFDATMIPSSRVNKLAFSSKQIGPILRLAVGSNDSSVRVYSVNSDILI